MVSCRRRCKRNYELKKEKEKNVHCDELAALKLTYSLLIETTLLLQTWQCFNRETNYLWVTKITDHRLQRTSFIWRRNWLFSNWYPKTLKHCVIQRKHARLLPCLYKKWAKKCAHHLFLKTTDFQTRASNWVLEVQTGCNSRENIWYQETWIASTLFACFSAEKENKMTSWLSNEPGQTNRKVASL